MIYDSNISAVEGNSDTVPSNYNESGNHKPVELKRDKRPLNVDEDLRGPDLVIDASQKLKKKCTTRKEPILESSNIINESSNPLLMSKNESSDKIRRINTTSPPILLEGSNLNINSCFDNVNNPSYSVHINPFLASLREPNYLKRFNNSYLDVSQSAIESSDEEGGSSQIEDCEEDINSKKSFS